MRETPDTEVRYFAAGLVTCALAMFALFFVEAAPVGTRNPEMHLYVQVAVLNAVLLLILFGALVGFTFSRKVLAPRRSLISSAIIGASAATLLASDMTKETPLAFLGIGSFFLGFFACWVLAEIFGKMPDSSPMPDDPDGPDSAGH